jgi:valyl-tRNA synthetase
MISNWPEFKEEWNFAADEHAVETIKEAVRAIRNVRTSMNVPPSKKAKVFVVSENEEVRGIFENSKVFFATLGYASEVLVQADKAGISEDAVSAVVAQASIYMPFAELVDIEKEIERLQKEEHIDELVVTDSIAVREDFNVKGLPFKFTVLSVANLIGEAIKRIHEGESVNSLFGESMGR